MRALCTSVATSSWCQRPADFAMVVRYSGQLYAHPRCRRCALAALLHRSLIFTGGFYQLSTTGTIVGLRGVTEADQYL